MDVGLVLHIGYAPNTSTNLHRKPCGCCCAGSLVHLSKEALLLKRGAKGNLFQSN
jgi:hypothetical protein